MKVSDWNLNFTYSLEVALLEVLEESLLEDVQEANGLKVLLIVYNVVVAPLCERILPCSHHWVVTDLDWREPGE